MESVKLEKLSNHKLKYTYIIEKIPDAFSSELFRNYAICKIGHSKNPENRVKKLQTGNDCKLKLVNFVPLLRFEKPLRDHYISIAHYIREGEWVALIKSDYESLIYLFENFFNETIRLNFGVACLNIPNKKLIPMCLGAQGLSEYNQRMLDSFEEKLKIELTIPNIYVLVAELLFDKCWLIENKTELQDQKVEEAKMKTSNIENNNNEKQIKPEEQVLNFLIEETCIHEQWVTIGTGMYVEERYKNYCAKNGQKEMSSASLRERIESIGFPWHQGDGYRGYVGLAFKDILNLPQTDENLVIRYNIMRELKDGARNKNAELKMTAHYKALLRNSGIERVFFDQLPQRMERKKKKK